MVEAVASVCIKGEPGAASNHMGTTSATVLTNMVVGECACADALSKYEALAASLPARQGLGSTPYRKYDGFWYPEHLMAPMLAVRDTFAVRGSGGSRSGVRW